MSCLCCICKTSTNPHVLISVKTDPSWSLLKTCIISLTTGQYPLFNDDQFSFPSVDNIIKYPSCCFFVIKSCMSNTDCLRRSIANSGNISLSSVCCYINAVFFPAEVTLCRQTKYHVICNILVIWLPCNSTYVHRPNPAASSPFSIIRATQWFPHIIEAVPPGLYLSVKEILLVDVWDTDPSHHLLSDLRKLSRFAWCRHSILVSVSAINATRFS